jgi:nucleoside-diphosphate-sugar epimerase
MTIASLRPTYVYQPNPEEENWRMRLPEDVVARHATKDYWSFVDVRDVAQAVLLSLKANINGHQAFLLTSDYTHARIPTIELVGKYYPHFPWPKVSPEEYTRDNPYRSLIDSAQAKQMLGWQPVFSQRAELLGEN